MLFPYSVIKSSDDMQDHAVLQVWRIIRSAMCYSVPSVSVTPFLVRCLRASSAKNMPLSTMDTPKMDVNLSVIVSPHNWENMAIIKGFDINDFLVELKYLK